MKKYIIFPIFVLIISSLLVSCSRDSDFYLQQSIFIEDPLNPGLPIYSEWGYNTFGVFVLFTFRLSPLDKKPRQTRISECMAVRRSDGTPFVYRLLLSENYIDDEKMKYFMGHLKLCTSENTSDGKELNILIKEKYISIAKNFFEGKSPKNADGESAVFADLEKHFGASNKSSFLRIINMLEQSPGKHVEKMLTINPSLFSKIDTEHLLLLGWIGKYGLSARHDKVENLMDDEVERIHKILYSDLHDDSGDWF